ncbi:MAG: SDR family oxidoreductase [Proteobacteria bacterium]|jgi:NAD(P)-dependent dehydrogenase (short-subunit alcohol dehydrogenase family)|nr:SDR family oxidoreductase [Pseudomonadota bacterium]
MQRLHNKVAVITGGTGGIGLASAKLFAAEGAQVVLVDLDQAALDRAVAEIGAERAMGVAADVTDPAQVEGYVKATLAKHGRLDVFFNNAGIEGAVGPITDYPLEMFDKVMAVNVRGVFLGLKYAIPAMAKSGGGSIVITSSLGGLRGVPKIGAYIASKHAVVGLMKSAALECAALKIRVNTINPSPIATRMIESLEAGYAPGATELVRKKMEAGVPLRRYGQPEEVAHLALFLASDESAYITGNSYPIDGGMSAA